MTASPTPARTGTERRVAKKGRIRQRARIELPEDAGPIVTRRLSKRYGDLVAVDNLDLDVKAGEIFGLLGQNGAGKTTTILMLLGLAEPSAGVARVVGFDPTRSPLEVKRRVGYLPDNVGFYDGMTGRADTNVDTYSRGMLQRLGIADALVKDPSVLILDEPTTAIDPIGVVEILDMLRTLVRERGLAILLSSHLLAQVQSVCDRVGIFAAGKMIGIGTVPDLAEQFGEESARVEVGFEGIDSGAAESTAQVLRSIKGVAEVRLPERPGEPFTVLAARDGTSAVREALLATAASRGLRLSSIREVVPSLDDIYRRAVHARGLAVESGAAA
jgi:ABC-2 type transport system ATP-binding protein